MATPTLYTFKLYAQKAEFYPVPAILGCADNLGCAVAYGPGCTLATETFCGTLAEALARLEVFAAIAPAPSQSRLVLDKGQRTPRGMLNAKTYANNPG